MGAGTGGAGWASMAHPGNFNLDGVIEDLVRLNDQRKDDFGL